MKVDLTSSNPSLKSIFKHPKQIITLDANFIIPPDRSKHAKFSFGFQTFKEVWLEPILEAFPNLAIHEAVYDELVLPDIQEFIDGLINHTPQRLVVHQDEDLTEQEKVLRDTMEDKIYPLTKYDPILDNKDDRGEVKSLAYIAVKELLYFAAHDSNAIQLVEKAEKLSTGLDNVQAIKMYELIYYLHKSNIGDKKSLRMLYKYQYHLTSYEKKDNPEWGQFIKGMDTLYSAVADEI